MVFAYKTIKSQGEGFYKEKGSKFIAKAYPVDNLEAVRAILDELKKEYHDARHHCYAYILDDDASQFRANDDGEPNHSAGDPILGQLRSHELTYVLVVVIRYFGGTKLGVSGLINAYKSATAEALAQSEIIRREVTRPIHLQFAYPETNEVMKLVDKHDITPGEQVFEADCKISGTIPLRHLQNLRDDVELLNNRGLKISLNT